MLRKQVVLQEILLDVCLSGEVALHAGREEAVAYPAGTFPRRAVHKDVEGALPDGLPGCIKYLVQRLVVAAELGHPHGRIAVVSQVQPLNGGVTCKCNLCELHGVGLYTL